MAEWWQIVLAGALGGSLSEFISWEDEVDDVSGVGKRVYRLPRAAARIVFSATVPLALGTAVHGALLVGLCLPNIVRQYHAKLPDEIHQHFRQ